MSQTSDEQSGLDRAAELVLLRRIIAGDVDAFTALVSHYYTPLVRFATRLVGSRDGAEDVLQDVWLRIWRGRATLSADEPIRAYVFTAVRRACANVHRARVREDSAMGRMLGVVVGEGEAERGVLDQIEHDEMSMALQHAVDALPARCRDVWLLAREQGLSYAEIASVLGISVNTVKTQMTRAMVALRAVAAGYLTLLFMVRG